MAKKLATCKESVSDGDSRWPRYHVCGRQVKKDGLCGLHLAVVARKDKGRLEYEESQRLDAAFQKRVEKAEKKLGVPMSPYFNSSFRQNKPMYTGDVVMKLDDLLKLVGVESE